MIKDEFDEVIEMLDYRKLTDFSSITNCMIRVHQFFRRVNEEFAVASKEEKAELVEMLKEIQKKLQVKLEEFYQKSGITEEQIQAAAAKIGTLPQTHQELIQLTQKEILDVGKNVKEHVTKKESGSKEVSKDQDKKRVKKTRGQWTKS